jgi:hypothetical protein
MALNDSAMRERIIKWLISESPQKPFILLAFSAFGVLVAIMAATVV